MTDDLIARLRGYWMVDASTVIEAADALEAQARRIASLEEQEKYLRQTINDVDKRLTELLEEKLALWRKVKEKDARIAELEAALKDAAELLSDAHGDIGRGGYGLGYTAARAALEKKDED